MADTFASFDNRLRQIERKNRKLARGQVTRIGADGLVRVRPRRRIYFPVKGFALLMLGFFAFKAILLAGIGEATYAERLELLRSGTIVEQAGAWALQKDRLTEQMAWYLGPIFH